LNGRSFAAESGVRFEAHALLDDAPPLDTFIVPGGRGLRETEPMPASSPGCKRMPGIAAASLRSAPAFTGSRPAVCWTVAG